MKIAIPTDFSVSSLLWLKEAVEKCDAEKLDIVLLHGIDDQRSIPEILFHSSSSLLTDIENKEFSEACRLIKNKYQSKINSICLDAVSKGGKAYLENFLLGNEIEEVFIPEKYNFHSHSDYSYDLIPLLKKSSIRKQMIQSVELLQSDSKETNLISALFRQLQPREEKSGVI